MMKTNYETMAMDRQSMMAEYGISECVFEHLGEDHIVGAFRKAYSKSGIPTIKMTMCDGTHRYLQPFRGYRFQVSGTIDGSGDHGASDVVGLGNMLKASFPTTTSNSSMFASNVEDLRVEFFRLLIEQAMKDYFIPHQLRMDWWGQVSTLIEDTIEWLDEMMKEVE